VIEELSDLPPGVIGFEVTGTLNAENYRDVVIPALERAAASGEVRFVIVIPEFRGMSGGALRQDLKVGIEHLRGLEAHCPGYRHRVDERHDHVVRLDDTR
jgi:hypothetical protein